ncbi:MAG TPA: anti-sigma factor [Acidobacteriaceae bacterium]|jgi:anti-sigma-K factor RskA
MNERHVNPEDPDLYALGALDGEEKQAYEAHVRQCTACAQELAAARERVALLGLAAEPETPGAKVKERLMQRVRQEAAGGVPWEKRGAEPRGRASRRSAAGWGWLTPALALTTVLFAAVAGWLGMQDARDMQRLHAVEGQLAEAQHHSFEIARTATETENLLGMPGTVRVGLKPMTGMPDGRVGVLYNAKMGMVTCAGWLPAPPVKKNYQLWLVPMKGKPMSLRVFKAEWNEPMMMKVPTGMEAKEFAVTVEPMGGMPWPTGPMVMEGAGE